jgi:hypothetical protein
MKSPENSGIVGAFFGQMGHCNTDPESGVFEWPT